MGQAGSVLRASKPDELTTHVVLESLGLAPDDVTAAVQRNRESLPVHARAITFDFLTQYLERVGKKNCSARTTPMTTTSRTMLDYIVRDTAPFQCSMAELLHAVWSLLDNDKGEWASPINKPTHFFSYSWDKSSVDIWGAAMSVAKTGHKHGIWLDVFCVNQHQVSLREPTPLSCPTAGRAS